MLKPSPFKIRPNLLPKTDPRYIKWRESLKKRPPSWITGKTKGTDARVLKISKTFKKKGIDNFAEWRNYARKIGMIPANYPSFKRDENLACLIGLVLGDGHIDKFPRTEKLTIALGTDKPDLIDFGIELVKKVFAKNPSVNKPSYSKVARISIYQKMISRRLGVPSGNRRWSKKGIPPWAKRKKALLLACLRGLYEAEGSLCIHLPTSTYNFAFHNSNPKLLEDVKDSLLQLGLHPEIRLVAIRLRKQKEVEYFRKLIQFRDYTAGWSNGSLVAL
ncbi:MAG: hypothetical protein UX99_C0010G0002 [Candidatus Amesbacteria bacterium GW2011_GWB1_47_26]|uniref:DOD-type homing endonuclease domain-containing protein n=1 Tax=Candidatus Amesbacteria bacterium GW2011_GWC2_45_19 TaxID=1618366 RepID=A0A0G1M538_9BACT|nr:MAG: hypothetical protein UX05_C0001G0010 [Candidatus Amesbacteria bacterium GW2011_GWC2_45_19]KKU38540.1 MAG: hypothetical protein UX52_C0004G0010 [Candidatus Amesbacteria bacterium GW2011_GWA1_46_35]KKU69639.1 MAG: hypothetical protein UX93_C0001G0224 [Microgenomates group bacterium GW2011_GWC1_47_20]KKU74595.1 MAG: hypothetical protein UX99_C0010G0002 [Candidatus Amesbacteria bacterium GW2011_GWB1_47_26]KKU79936.1 MAG: hypothetical protein UY06_C0010G0005 [Candidatus Amesbacteria bacteriu